MKETRVLVVDDEAAERITLGEVLRLEGFRVTLAASGEEALSLAMKGPPFDVAILDLRLPGIDGIEVLENLHRQSPQTVVILITGYATLETAISALRKGAYDYLLKPCPVEQILEAVRRGLSELEKERHRQTLMRTLQETVRELVDDGDMAPPSPPASPRASDRVIQVRDVIIDQARHLATRQGEPLNLTPTEFHLLRCLMQRVDEVCTPQELVRCAQGYEADAWGARSIIRVHIRRLRSKLEPNPEEPTYIVNVRGVGYMFVSDPSTVRR